ncbi:hypothetical protein E1B22_03750 [Thermaerobacter sp. FW80]|uniref:hypothetical protein n=1 Tax=Thermaerobacter sp. FW80 TaxID=2546351 RepID=UPI001075280F|nr:hypothetical protein [Thermaerobacter sp. FW80]QBS37111.1 hypothetical protein E1B22_03750 [Thermaerobacter sp. FW80]
MSPDELIARARKLGATIGRSTLNLWKREGLVTPPKEGSLGRGRGRFADYPEEALWEAVAAWAARNKAGLRTTNKRIRAIREELLAWYASGFDFRKLKVPYELLFHGVGQRYPVVVGDSPFFNWLVAYEKAKAGIPLAMPVELSIVRVRATGEVKLEIAEASGGTPDVVVFTEE